jgi:phage protein D
MNISQTTFKVFYENKNITQDISDHIISLSYTDKVEGESDEIELNLEDADLLWQNAWYPEKGAQLDVEIEQNGFVLKCGAFTIDEIEMSSSRSGDVISIRGLATSINQSTRTRRSSAHENKTLRELANTIAAANGLKVEGTISDITFNRVTQYQETDLGFLKRLAADYGYIFSIRGETITFTSIKELEARNHVLTIDKTGLLSYSLKDKTEGTYETATVSYHDANGNKLIKESSGNDESSKPLSNAEYTAYKQAINNLTNVITQAIMPALKNQDKERLSKLPQQTTVTIKQNIKMITNITTSATIKNLGQKIYFEYINEYNSAASIGNFKAVSMFEILLSKYVAEVNDSLNRKVHSKVKKDTLHITTKVENKQQAEALANAALHRANSMECSGSLSMPGNTLVIAGNNIELTGMGTLSGIKHIISSTHTIDRSGYTTSAEVKRLQAIPVSKHKPLRKINTEDGVTSNTEYTLKNATDYFVSKGAINTFGQ